MWDNNVSSVQMAVRIVGGASKVARELGVSRSQVYRWIAARTMAHAIYRHVEKLSDLSGIDVRNLGMEFAGTLSPYLR